VTIFTGAKTDTFQEIRVPGYHLPYSDERDAFRYLYEHSCFDTAKLRKIRVEHNLLSAHKQNRADNPF
jgi:hypothetical protein